MEGFDSNPFDETNPFADSSVNQARKTNETREAQLDNYNPFAKDQFAHQQPAVIQPSETRSLTFVPPSSSATLPVVTSLTNQQEELERRAAELDKRERDLNARVIGNPNNFPPLPSCFPCKPCFVQDINVDIPLPFQKIVRIHYYTWIAYSILMLLNLLGSLAYMIVDGTSTSGTTFGLSIFYFILFPSLSYVVWFRAVYKAFKNDSSLNYFLYFIVFFIHNCINIFWCIGVPSSGAVGFISGLTMIGTNKGVGVFMIIIGTLFGAVGGVGVVLILRVLHFYRNMDASFKKAQEELASGVLSNRGLQQVVIDTTASTMREQPNRF